MQNYSRAVSAPYGRWTGGIPQAISVVARPGSCRRLRFVEGGATVRAYTALTSESPKRVSSGAALSAVPDLAAEERNEQVAQVCALLRVLDTRLVSLTGITAEVKSTIISGVAAVLGRELSSGVVTVDLARTRQRSGIAQAVAEALRIREVAPMLLNEVVTWIRGKQLLLILENVEQQLDCDQSIERLLDACPQLRVLLASPLERRLVSEQRVVLHSSEPLTEARFEAAPAPSTWRVLQQGESGRPIVRRVSGWCLQPGVATDYARLSPLTRREQQVAQLLALGLSNKEIADELVVTYRTAETHACRVLRKLGFSCRGHVVQWAIERGLVVVASRQA
jgi:DNA-binding CsgD family transcriptional regulator